jgi:hypothetical protein
VQFIHDAARRIANWSYGLAAVVYLFMDHAIANRAHRH